MLLLFFVLSFFYPDVWSLPLITVSSAAVTVGNTTSALSNVTQIAANDTIAYVHWKSTPRLRGTADLLISCSSTLFLCVYSALHFDLFGEMAVDNRWAIPFVKAAWVLIAIFAPEVLVYKAWIEWRAARDLTKRVNKYLNKDNMEPYIKKDGDDEEKEMPGTPEGGDDAIEPVAADTTTDAPLHDIEHDAAANPVLDADDSGEKATKQPEVTVQESKSSSQPNDLKPLADDQEKVVVTWTNVHSFFAISGGFIVENKGRRKSPYLSSDRYRFNRNGIVLLAMLGKLPDIQVEEIRDKSKTNELAKFLTCMQAIWMVIQTLGRLADHLPITPLEVNTIAHCICAIFVYIWWWEKPQNIETPVILKEHWVEDLKTWYGFAVPFADKLKDREEDFRSYQWFDFLSTIKHPGIDGLAKAIEDHDPVDDPDDDADLVTDFHFLFMKGGKVPPTSDPEIKSYGSCHEDTHPLKFATDEKNTEIENETKGTPLEDVLKSWELDQVVCPCNAENIVGVPLLSDVKHGFHISNEKHGKKLQALIRALPQFPILAAVWKSLYTLGYQRVYLDIFEEDDERSFQFFELDVWKAKTWMTGEIAILVIFILGPSVYGALHLAAWNHVFPTIAEAWLWRASAITIATAGIAAIVVGSMISFLDDHWQHWISDLIQAFCGIVLIAIALCYGASRVFLIIEAYISLRWLPPGAYDTPEWSAIFPHI